MSPGCHITCRPIGMLTMRDEKGLDLKILAVPVWDERTELNQMPAFLLTGIRHFFDVYKDIDTDKYTEVGDWAGRAAAEAEVAGARTGTPQAVPSSTRLHRQPDSRSG